MLPRTQIENPHQTANHFRTKAPRAQSYLRRFLKAFPWNSTLGESNSDTDVLNKLSRTSNHVQRKPHGLAWLWCVRRSLKSGRTKIWRERSLELYIGSRARWDWLRCCWSTSWRNLNFSEWARFRPKVCSEQSSQKVFCVIHRRLLDIPSVWLLLKSQNPEFIVILQDGCNWLLDNAVMNQFQYPWKKPISTWTLKQLSIFLPTAHTHRAWEVRGQ